jgi:hypothetical protein
MSPVLRLSACLLVAASLAACNKSDTATGGVPGTTEAPADAQPAPAAPADAAPPAAVGSAGVTLTMDKVRAMAQALKNLQGVEQVDPETGDSVIEQSSEESSDQYAARLEGIPSVRAAIERAGLSTGEFVRIHETLFAAMIIQGTMESGQMTTVPEGTDPANVEFVKQHKDELKALMESA